MLNIKAYPVIGIPFLLTLIIGIASIPISLQVTELSMQEMSRISIEMYGMDITGFAGSQELDIYGDEEPAVDPVVLVTAIVGAVSTPLIGAFFSALGLWILTKIFRGEARLAQYFSMYIHIWVLSAVGTVITSWLMVNTGRPLDLTSLAAVLMPQGDISMPVFNMLSTVSIFGIWTSVLVFFGVKYINSFSTVKAVIITLVGYAAASAVAVLILMSTFIIWNFTMGQLI
jgi:hypothetical protein